MLNIYKCAICGLRIDSTLENLVNCYHCKGPLIKNVEPNDEADQAPPLVTRSLTLAKWAEIEKIRRVCENCRFYKAAWSTCHRLPPHPCQDVDDDAGRIFPRVDRVDWCGEFTPNF